MLVYRLSLRAIAGNDAAHRQLTQLLLAEAPNRLPPPQWPVRQVRFDGDTNCPRTPPSLLSTLMALGAVRPRATRRFVLEDWVVTAALARLGERQLTLAEQWAVRRAVPDDGAVSWPQWWAVPMRQAAAGGGHPAPGKPAKRVRKSKGFQRTRGAAAPPVTRI